MALATPEWLARHGGELRPGVDGHSRVAYFDGRPHYTLVPVPVKGRHGCCVMQTINGKRVDTGGAYNTVEDALRGGLEDLRKALGW